MQMLRILFMELAHQKRQILGGFMLPLLWAFVAINSKANVYEIIGYQGLYYGLSLAALLLAGPVEMFYMHSKGGIASRMSFLVTLPVPTEHLALVRLMPSLTLIGFTVILGSVGLIWLPFESMYSSFCSLINLALFFSVISVFLAVVMVNFKSVWPKFILGVFFMIMLSSVGPILGKERLFNWIQSPSAWTSLFLVLFPVACFIYKKAGSSWPFDQ